MREKYVSKVVGENGDWLDD